MPLTCSLAGSYSELSSKCQSMRTPAETATEGFDLGRSNPRSLSANCSARATMQMPHRHCWHRAERMLPRNSGPAPLRTRGERAGTGQRWFPRTPDDKLAENRLMTGRVLFPRQIKLRLIGPWRAFVTGPSLERSCDRQQLFGDSPRVVFRSRNQAPIALVNPPRSLRNSWLEAL